MFNRLRKWFDSASIQPYHPRRTRLLFESLEDRTQPTGLVGLGAASSFGILSLNGGNLTMNSSHIVGNVGLGPNGTSTLQKTDITGRFIGDPSAQVDLSKVNKDFLVTGGVTSQSLVQAEADANAASAAYAALPATQSLGSITTSMTITGTGGINVITINSLAYNSKSLTFSGTSADVFVVNVSGGFTFADSKILLIGGVTPNRVIFNFPTAGPTIDMYKATNVVNGTFLAPQRSLIYHNPASFTGALIAKNLNIHSNANLSAAPFAPPVAEGGSASLSGSVWFDANQDGVFDPDFDYGIEGVTIYLIGVTASGASITLVTSTDGNGNFGFTNLDAGTYTLTEEQPADFTDGIDYNGIPVGAPGDYEFTAIQLASGQAGTGYMFTEYFGE